MVVVNPVIALTFSLKFGLQSETYHDLSEQLRCEEEPVL